MFRLSKWYTDLVSEDGAAFIGYWARMRWGPVVIPYAATLYRPVGGPNRERFSIRRCSGPRIRNRELRWNCRRLHLGGVWTGRSPAIHRKLLETADGSITWSCHIPSADARVDLAGRILSGQGYAEHLDMYVKPWRLPFDELRWGRFVSAEDALTWIEWRGEESASWCFHNGSELEGVIVDSDRIQLPGDREALELRDATVLRDGRLAETALRVVPGTSLWLHPRVRDAHETRWLARGELRMGSRSTSGWVMHEVVRLR
jgi:hypothetical protein